MKKHSLLEIVKDNTARLTHVCNGKAYYEITVQETKYQLELNSLDEDWKDFYIQPEYKTVTLMRWIRKALKDNTLLKLN